VSHYAVEIQTRNTCRLLFEICGVFSVTSMNSIFLFKIREKQIMDV
jgi:hypothetical protein